MDTYNTIGERNTTGFRGYYNDYLSLHKNKTNQKIHLLGAVVGLAYLLYAILTFHILGILIGIVIVVACNLIGHMLIEKNKHCINHPYYSFMATYFMSYQAFMVMIGKRQNIGDLQTESSNGLFDNEQ